MRFCAAGDVGRQPVMDVSDTKVSLHLADAGSEVTKRTVEQTEEGEERKKKNSSQVPNICICI